MFLWNSFWTMFMWNSSRLFVPCKSEIMKSKGNGFWYQTWEANFNSQDFSVWLWEEKNHTWHQGIQYMKILFFSYLIQLLVSSHLRIGKCAECWRLFPINWQSKPLVPAVSHCCQSFSTRRKLLMISESVTCTAIQQSQWCPLYGALLCLLSQPVLERHLFANKLAKSKCALYGFFLHILWVIFSKFVLSHFSLPHHPEEERAGRRICI